MGCHQSLWILYAFQVTTWQLPVSWRSNKFWFSNNIIWWWYWIILEVDLEYPHQLHDTHSDLPLAPEHLKLTPDMFSDYRNTNSSFHRQIALTPNLYNKMKYVLYLRNLQLYTQLGMKVLKMHRVLAFDQKQQHFVQHRKPPASTFRFWEGLVQAA